MIRTVAIVAVLALPLGGCGGLIAKSDLLGVNEKATPEAQRIKAEADARWTDAMIRRLDHCAILGNLDFTAQLSAASGLKTAAGVNCQPKPWSLEDLGRPDPAVVPF